MFIRVMAFMMPQFTDYITTHCEAYMGKRVVDTTISAVNGTAKHC